MAADPTEKSSDARTIGLAARAVRRARNMTAQQVANLMGLPLRTYEYFEAGSGRVNLDYVHRFAAATNCDPYAMLLGPALGSTEFARRTADSKMILIFLIALGEFESRMEDRLLTLDPRGLIEVFTEAFRKIEADILARERETESWLDAGRDRLAGKPQDDDA